MAPGLELASRHFITHPVVTTAPVPWMSSLKHSTFFRMRSRISNACSAKPPR